MRRAINKRVQPYDLTTLQYTTLSVLGRRGALSNAQLARRSYMSPQAMSEVIEALEKRGLIERSRHPHHRTVESDDVRIFPGQARPRRARAGDPRALGARGDVRAAAGEERGRPAVQLLRRPRHREQVARRPHGLGTHAQGRLPALQGAARLPPALPERLRLPGSLDRGRRRALARAQLEARDRGVRARRVRAQVP